MGRILSTALALAALFISGCGSSGGGGGGTGGGQAPDPGPGPGPGPDPGPTPPPPQVLAGKDLHFANVMAMPQNQAGRFTVHSTIRYTDTDGSTASAVAYQLRRENGTVLTEGAIPQLEPGESRMLMLEVEGIADRERLIVAVDPANSVAEVYEENNTVTVTAIMGETPAATSDIDLAFTDSHYHGTYYYRDPRLHFFVVNTNQQGVAASDVKVLVRVNGAESWSRVYPTIPAASAAQLADDTYEGREITLGTSDIFGTPNVPVGRYVLTVTIDPDNTIVEQNEANNYRRMIVEVDAGQSVSIEPAAVPDIQLEDPHFHQYPTYCFYHFWISNIHGGAGSQSVEWHLVDEEGAIVRSGTEAVTPQELKEVVFSVPKAGIEAERRYRLIFDPANTIPERDETNNEVPFIVDWTPESSG